MTHMYFSPRAEGRISYGHLGRTNSCCYSEFDKTEQQLRVMYCWLTCNAHALWRHTEKPLQSSAAAAATAVAAVVINIISVSQSSSGACGLLLFIFYWLLSFALDSSRGGGHTMNRPVTDSESLSLIVKRRLMAPISNRYDRTSSLHPL